MLYDLLNRLRFFLDTKDQTMGFDWIEAKEQLQAERERAEQELNDIAAAEAEMSDVENSGQGSQ